MKIEDYNIKDFLHEMEAREPKLTREERDAMWNDITAESRRLARRAKIMRLVAAAAMTALIIGCIMTLRIHSANNDRYNSMLMAMTETKPVAATIFLGNNKFILPKRIKVEIDGQQHLITVKQNGGNVSWQLPEGQDLAGFSVPKGCQMQLTLSDKSVSPLRGGSYLIAPFDMTAGKERHVSLKGEAYMSISHDSKRPFTATAGAMEVKVLGTRFLLSAKENENESITLIEGSVDVSCNNKTIARLTPGQTLSYDNNSGKHSLKQENEMRNIALWKDEVMSVDNCSLTSVIEKLQNIYEVDIIFDPAFTDSIMLKGNMEIDADIMQVLRRLETITPINVSQTGDTICITPAA